MDGVISTEGLSERERAYLEHMRQARELKVGLAEYCRTFDLDVREWYAVKRELVRRGVLPGRGGKSEAEEDEDGGAEPSAFIPVRIGPSSSPRSQVLCRIRHPHGWVFELLEMPAASWVAALVAEDADAAPVR
jgi:hypothetical protein